MSAGPRKPAPRFSAGKRARLAGALAERGLAREVEGCIPRRAKPDAPAPLSASQERAWLAEQLLGGAPVYHVPLAAHLLGPLDAGALGRALRALGQRHDLLRARFVAEGESVVQLAPQELALDLETTDLSRLESSASPCEAGTSESYARALELARAEFRRPFDLERGPPVRGTLWRLAPDEHLLLVALHHIVCDGVTIRILCRELEELYAAELEGRAPRLAPPGLQHADFAAWQQEQLSGEEARRSLDHWTARLRGSELAPDLPADHPRPAEFTFAGAWRSRALDPALWRALDALARERRATPFQLLLSAFFAWLHRHTGADDLRIGIPIGLRDRSELEELPGFLVNTLVLRATVDASLGFCELLSRVQEALLEAQAHRAAPFERVLEALAPGRDPARTPLFQAMFDHRAGLASELRLSGLGSGRLLGEDELHSATSKVDLALYSEVRGERLVLSAEYRTDLFEPETIERFLERFEVLLAGIAANPASPLGELPLLGPEERRLVLETWAHGRRASGCESTVHETFAAHAARLPGTVALEQDGERLSYGELDGRANRLARHLRELGVARGEPVALCLCRSSELVVAQLAILKAGGAYLPLDPAYPVERLRFMLEDSGARVLVTEEALLERLPSDEHRGERRMVLVDRDRARIEERSAAPPSPLAGPDDPAYLIYTSGSTGVPKGVACPHRGVLRLFASGAERDWLAFDPPVRMLHLAPESFDASVLDTWAPLLTGGTLVLHPEGTPELARLERLVREHRIDTLFLTTALFHAVVDEAPEILARLRQVATGGEALSLAHLRRARARFPELHVANCYGPTEASVIATRWIAPVTLPPELACVPIGSPIADTSAYVLDAGRRPVPIGVPGELCVGGPAIARGYWRRPELTAERFVREPFGAGRLYRTGDRARWRSDGTLEFLGRDDDQVKIRGHRIEPAEIGARLAEHPRVRAALVLARQEAPGEQRLVAYIVPDPEQPPSPGELARHLAERLPEYLRPEQLVLLDSFPLTPGGKIDRAALPAPAAPAVPESTARAAPAGETESLLAAQWAELLGRTEIGRHDDFFALGGHSLSATVLLARVRRLFAVELPLAAVFRERTLARLARTVDERRASAPASPPLVARPRTGSRAPLSPNQRGLWFLQELAPSSASYNVPFAIPLCGRLEVCVLERAVREIVRRHEALRTRFPLADGEPCQEIDEERFRLETLEPGRAETRDVLEDFARQPFDLRRGPLFRAGLLRAGDDEALLAINVHHAVFDGWSLEVFVDELRQLYGAFAEGRAPALEPLAIQYADHALWQHERLSSGVGTAEVDFWRQELAGAPLVLELPADRPRPAVPSWRGARVRRELPRELVERLRDLARAEGATPYLAGLALAEVLLARTSGVEDLVLGTPVAGRSHPACERSIGLFLNVVALRADLGGEPGFRELLGRTRERVLRAHAHQGFPFERLCEVLGVSRDPSITPVYQVLYSLRRADRAARAAGLSFEPAREIDTGTAKTDLAITIEDSGTGWLLDLTYATDLFDQATIARLAEHFERLLAAALAEPSRSVWELELLSTEERRLLLGEWSGPAAPYPCQESIATLFERAADRSPEALALVFREQRLTYRELNERANRLAHRLVELGVERESRVGLALERSSETIVALLAILKAGGAYVPLDPSYPRERLAFMLEDSGIEVLLTSSELRPELPPAAASVVVLDHEWPEIRSRPAVNPSARSSGADLAYVMYTSGSTGRPKGVEIPQHAISRLVFGANYARLDASCTHLQLGPLAFDASTLEIWGALLHGARLVLYPGRVPSVRELERVLHEHRVTTIFLTTALFNAIVDERPGCLSGLRECLTGGEAVSVAHVRRAQQSLPETVQLVNVYGPTENTTFTTFHPIPRELPSGLASIPIGTPITNTKVYVVDARLRAVPIGVAGELLTGGAGLARGYHGRPELNAERFIANPFGPGKLYRTGDIVRWLPDGNIEFLGRTDDQVKIRGHRIEPAEVGMVLGAHPSVRKAFVTVHRDPRAGKRLVAYLEAQGAAPRSQELAAWLSERLPDYMIPASFTFVKALPMNANGKVDRQRLPEPAFESRAAGRPRNELEGLLSSLWAQVLGVESVGPEDDFFELGGHSLLAVKLVQAIGDTFGQELELAALLEAPTLEAQAQLLYSGVGTRRASALVKLQTSGSRPPIFCVCSLGGTVLNQRPLALCLGPEQPFYGLQAVDLEPGLGRPARIEDYAAAYVEAMRSVAPRGPYVIGGHSFGGIVSFEIAQQLTGLGEEVALLFILDSSLPNLDRRLMDRLAGLLAFARGLPFVPAEALSQLRRDPEELARALRAKLRFVRGRVRSSRPEMPAPDAEPAARDENARLDVRDLVAMQHWPENNRRIAERHWRAVLAYRPGKYPGRITLFRSRFHSPFLGLGRQMGWDRVALGGVEVVSVPGGHLSVLQPPNVDTLASKLAERLARRGRAA